jgi:UDP-N-acetylmuramoyl-tripeptide--D-alanyl-D-alanine ligase
MKWTLGELAQACDGVLPAGLDPLLGVNGVSTDTRALAPGEVFLALKGERFDGHDFVIQALGQGAVAAVVSRPLPEQPERQVLVPDTLVALGCIARGWRLTLPARVAAITGSAGKTTTKGLLASICEQAGPTVAAAGTENNAIGVPRTLLRLKGEHRFCVVEFGMRGRGEIKQLTEIARPDVGIITTIGEAHIGRLGSREAIAESKAEMLPLLPPDGAAVLPADDFFFPVLASLCPCPVLPFGFGPEARVRCLEVHAQALASVRATVLLDDVTVDLTVPLPGRHNLANALAAAAGGLALGCTPDHIRQGIEAYAGLEMRGEVMSGPAGTTILNDAYNANPDSVAAALEVLGQAAGRRVFVFGDMLELGQFEAEAHQRVGEQAAETGVSLLVTVGDLAALAADAARNAGVEVVTTGTPEEAADRLLPLLQAGDTILVKASRGTALERTVGRLRNGG